MSYFDDRYRHGGNPRDGHDVRGLMCERDGCHQTILFPYTYQGVGVFCSQLCAHIAAARVGADRPSTKASA